MRVDVDSEGNLKPDWESFIFEEIADKRMHRNTIAQTYRYLMESQKPSTDWAKINRAIIDRWSMSGLLYIKNQAWSGKCFDSLSPA